MGSLPTTIGGKYTVVRRIGKGGMGTVFEAIAEDTGARVAVKVIAGDIGEDVTLVTRFQREARATAALDTPHIVKIFEAGVDPVTHAPYMAMEHLEGEDLRQILKRTGPLPPETAVRIAIQACRALDAAHGAKILHRDIKPANLFVARSVGGPPGPSGVRVVKLLDFGVAKVQHPELNGDAEETGLTRTGAMIGSPLYMSPEQARGYRNIDGRSDLWSLGVVLYQMLAGRTPHQKIDELGELVVRICTEPPPPLTRRAPWVPPRIAEVVHLALAMEAQDRFPDAKTLLLALESLVPPGEITEDSLRPLTDAERGSALAETSNPSLDDRPTRRPPDDPRGSSESNPIMNPVARQAITSSPAILADSRAGGGPVVLSQPPSASTLTNSSASVPAPIVLPPERKTWRFATIGLVAGAVAAVTYIGFLRGPAHPGAGETSQSAAGEARPRSIKVVVLPKDATVQVDGAPVENADGVVEVTGSLGSVHKFRVSAGGETRNVEVAITDNGPVPAKIEIEPPRRDAAAPGSAQPSATASVNNGASGRASAPDAPNPGLPEAKPSSDPRPTGQVYTTPKPRPTATAETPAPTVTHTGRTLRDDR